MNLNDEDIEEIISKFKNAISEIKNCNFEPKKDNCKYCAYRGFCAIQN